MKNRCGSVGLFKIWVKVLMKWVIVIEYMLELLGLFSVVCMSLVWNFWLFISVGGFIFSVEEVMNVNMFR